MTFRSGIGGMVLLFRPNRTAMVAMVTGCGAFVAGAGTRLSLYMALCGWLLAVGGFSLDFFADRRLDSQGPRSVTRHNPLASGAVPPRFGLLFSLFFLAASLATTLAAPSMALLPWAVIVAVLLGLALHVLDRPLIRAVTLGLLQALYLVMGGCAGRITPGLLLLCGTFLFAMTGGRGMTDVRDFAQDEAAGSRTLVTQYGVRRTALFTTVCLLISFGFSTSAYFTGEFGYIYLWLILAFVILGTGCAALFVLRPTPRLAYVLTLVCMMGLGSLLCAAMVLGKLGH